MPMSPALMPMLYAYVPNTCVVLYGPPCVSSQTAEKSVNENTIE